MSEQMLGWLHSLFGPVVDWKQVLLLSMTPVFLLAFLTEWSVFRLRSGSWQTAPGERFYWKEVLANVSLGYGYYAAEAIMHLLLVGAIFATVYEHRLWTLPITVWTVPLVFVIEEFCYYWYHRAAHRVRWFWSQHVSHHSGEIMNMSTASRQSILNGGIGVWLFFLPPIFLGVHPGLIALMLGVNLTYQFFIHTEVVGKFHPFLEWLLDTPSNHRVHHGRNAQYIDKNYGGVLMIFDHLFGTYEPEVEKVEYGTPRQIKSYNFLVLNCHEFVDMLRDVAAPGPLWQRLKHLWMPPDWQRPGHTPIHTWTVERKLPAGEPVKA
ncbi:Sterol desaturase/sphingolipid hydroxylase, fatty acid hydroxylase superfamily [Solimonas aquatica]|uniref:Sterol desaturase/sphingolipid hydroxylase, fatty acid hydroxylase superfamily n=1 Tax=Solimonas aquatica TaxID=489703 RepID=A0A1H9I0E8_9GAMM|nr:sterol desaturase family protein [Solimonas aquatica]SEQ68013.1 Sterol desaturase/sphingolipid hydroxylase, fatty acid hydroxylase superfamily [Solimonas aquatica]